MVDDALSSLGAAFRIDTLGETQLRSSYLNFGTVKRSIAIWAQIPREANILCDTLASTKSPEQTQCINRNGRIVDTFERKRDLKSRGIYG